MISPSAEKRLLQIVIALLCLVPLSAGLGGVIGGIESGHIDLDSHFRYLSGLLLGIGLGFLSAVPNIECRTATIRLLTAIVVIGGISRLLGVLLAGIPGPAMLGGLVMELLVTPLICLWQHRVAERLK